MHCNLRPPELCEPFPALMTMPCQVWRRWIYSLPYYSVFAADTLHYVVTLTFDLWPWTIAVYRLWHDETRYQIWTQSSNPRRSYCDFSVWPYDLEHCIFITHCARLWDNFHQVWYSITYTCLNYSVFDAGTLCHAVTLTFDPVTFKVRGTSSVTWSKAVRNLSEIKQFPVELLFANFCTRYVTSWHWPLTFDLELL